MCENGNNTQVIFVYLVLCNIDYDTDANARTLFRIFRCPTCPTCPSPVVCPTCPTPATPVDGALFIPTTTGKNSSPLISHPSLIFSFIRFYYDEYFIICLLLGCTTRVNSLDATLAPCTRASAAPKGTIEVIFTATTTSVIIGILGATPTTAIKLTCTSFPTTFLGVTVIILLFYFYNYDEILNNIYIFAIDFSNSVQ
jgi:hypothetical protein